MRTTQTLEGHHAKREDCTVSKFRVLFTKVTNCEKASEGLNLKGATKFQEDVNSPPF